MQFNKVEIADTLLFGCNAESKVSASLPQFFQRLSWRWSNVARTTARCVVGSRSHILAQSNWCQRTAIRWRHCLIFLVTLVNWSVTGVRWISCDAVSTGSWCGHLGCKARSFRCRTRSTILTTALLTSTQLHNKSKFTQSSSKEIHSTHETSTNVLKVLLSTK